MNAFQKQVIFLISAAFKKPQEKSLPNFDWGNIYSLGMRHQIIPILFYGALNCGANIPVKINEQMELINYKAIFINQNQLWELERLTKEFDENAIDYVLLKGSVLKALYPHPEMRQMGDADILIKTKQYDKIQIIMNQLGFLEEQESDHELIWNKPQTLHVELHKRLIPSYNKDFYAYFGDGWRLTVPSGSGTRFEITDENQFIYLFTHFAKHYRDAGIGIRHILDLWVYLNAKPDLNKAYLHEELKKLQLDVFYNNIIRTLEVWFSGRPADDLTDFITDHVFNSGVYGSEADHILSAALKTAKSNGSKLARVKIFFELIFLPYSGMCRKYPFLKKIPILLPLMWAVRWFTALFCKRRSIQTQRDHLKLQTAENIDRYQAELNYVGLDFNFK